MSLSKLPIKDVSFFFNKNVSDKKYKDLINNLINSITESNISSNLHFIENNFNKKYGNNIKQKKIYINTYVLPLLYIIYSNYYTKYNIQCEKIISNSNCLNKIENLQYMYSYNNPIIYQVNVYFYKKYFNVKKNNNSSNEIDDSLSGIIKQKEDIKKYLESYVNLLNVENKKSNYFDKLTKKITKLVEELNTMNTEFKGPTLTNINNKLPTNTGNINNNITILKNNIKILIDNAIDIIDKSNKKTILIQNIKSYLKKSNQLLIYCKILKNIGTPENYAIFIDIFQKIIDIFNSQISSYSKLNNSSNNKNIKKLYEEKIIELTNNNNQSINVLLKNLKVENMSDSFKEFFNNSSSSSIEVKLNKSAKIEFNENANTPINEIPKNSPLYNIAGYMTELLIYDTILNSKYIKFKFKKQSNSSNNFDSKKILQVIVKTKIDIESQLDIIKKKNNKKWSLEDFIKKQKQIYDISKGNSAPISSAQSDYFKDLETRQKYEIEKKIIDDNKNNIDNIRDYPKAYIIIKKLRADDDTINSLTNDKQFIKNLDNNIKDTSTKNDVITLINDTLKKLNNEANLKILLGKGLDINKLDAFIKAYDDKLKDVTTYLDKNPITEKKEKYINYLVYTFYDQMSKDLGKDSAISNNFKNNLSFLNPSKNNLTNTNISKIVEDLSNSFVSCDKIYQDFLNKINFKQQDNKLMFFLKNDSILFNIIDDIIKDNITFNLTSDNKMNTFLKDIQKKLSDYIKIQKDSTKNKDQFMIQIEKENNNINDLNIRSFFDEVFQKNKDLLKDINQVLKKKNIKYDISAKDKLGSIKDSLIRLKTKIENEKNTKKNLTNTKNLIYIYPYTDVLYLYFLLLNYLNLLFKIS